MDDIMVVHHLDDAFAILIRDHAIRVDQPYSAGGGDDGPTPVELFVASVAACAAYYARQHLRRRSLPAQGLEVSARFAKSHSGPPRVTSIAMTVRPPVDLPATELPGLYAAIDRCTVHNTLRQPPEITVTVTDVLSAA